MYYNDTVQKKLRATGLISNDEVLLKEGDLFIALNVVSQQRRIVPSNATLLETINLKTESSGNKQLLKG
tara:strand:- start:77 stop:283 length:207 start_codon:yes stop_codon:yes gene_type:complete